MFGVLQFGVRLIVFWFGLYCFTFYGLGFYVLHFMVHILQFSFHVLHFTFNIFGFMLFSPLSQGTVCIGNPKGWRLEGLARCGNYG